MRSIEELRQAMRDETRDLAPRVTFREVRQRARRRRLAGLVTFAAAVLIPVGATMTALAGGPAGPAPAPTLAQSHPGPSVTNFVAGTEMPGTGPLIRTGVAYGGDEELVFRYSGDEMNGLSDGLHNTRTGQFRRLDGGLSASPGNFSTVLEFQDKQGGIVDYGLVTIAGVRVGVSWDGQHADAGTAEVPGMPGTTVFWVRRTGVAVAPTGAVDGPSPDLVFTARDSAGAVVATGGGERVQRSDGGIVITDTAVQIGDLMPTGVVLADGGRLVLWFRGDERGVSLVAGSDDGSGAPTELRGLGRYARPPFDIGFYGGRFEFDQPGGTEVVLHIYVGPAETVTLAAPVSTGHGSVRWSAHPQLRIGWIAGVPAQDVPLVTSTAEAAGGKVIARGDDLPESPAAQGGVSESPSARGR